jgi:mono/diheme cytochrome c family protein
VASAFRRKIQASSAIAALVTTLTGAAASQSDTEPSRSTLEGVYNTAQASRGEETYMAVCVGCHPAGTYATPIFRTTWTGRPLSELFETVKEKMPKNDPGSLTPPEAAQVLAYLLKINDVPAGDAELPGEPAVLKKLRFETPATREGKAAR